MTRSSPAGGGSAGGGGEASGCDAGAASDGAADVSARSAFFASRRASRRDFLLSSGSAKKGRELPENGGAFSRHSPAVIEATAASSVGKRIASLSSGGDRSSGIWTGCAELAVD